MSDKSNTETRRVWEREFRERHLHPAPYVDPTSESGHGVPMEKFTRRLDWKWIGISCAITIATASFTWVWGQNAQSARITQQLYDQQQILQQISTQISNSQQQERGDVRQINERIDNLQQTLLNKHGS